MVQQRKSLRLWFRLLEPRVLGMMQSPVFVRIRPWIDKHDLFSFVREPLARGLAFGLFCSLIPGPLQMLGTLAAFPLVRCTFRFKPPRWSATPSPSCHSTSWHFK